MHIFTLFERYAIEPRRRAVDIFVRRARESEFAYSLCPQSPGGSTSIDRSYCKRKSFIVKLVARGRYISGQNNNIAESAYQPTVTTKYNNVQQNTALARSLPSTIINNVLISTEYAYTIYTIILLMDSVSLSVCGAYLWSLQTEFCADRFAKGLKILDILYRL